MPIAEGKMKRGKNVLTLVITKLVFFFLLKYSFWVTGMEEEEKKRKSNNTAAEYNTPMRTIIVCE